MSMAKREHRVAALPIYNVSASLRDDWAMLTEQTAQVLGRGTSSVILGPVNLDESPGALRAFWRHDDVSLSRTCGYLLIRGLVLRVQLAGIPRFVAPGYHQETYSGAIVVRVKDGPTTLTACRGTRVACNGPDSHSGMNVPRHAVAPLMRGTRFFGAVVYTRLHLRSLVTVASDEADVATIDCVVLAFAAEHRPGLVVGLRQIGSTRHVAGLPFIAARRADDALVKRVRKATCEVLYDDADLRLGLRLENIVPAMMAHYWPIAVMVRETYIYGYGGPG